MDKKLIISHSLGIVLLCVASVSYAQSNNENQIDEPKACKALKKYAKKNDTKRLEKFFSDTPNFKPDCISDDDRRVTPLFIASANYSKDAVDFLLDMGGNANAVSDNGVSLLMQFVQSRPKNQEKLQLQISILDRLLEENADINYVQKDTGYNVIYSAVAGLNYKIVPSLVQRGADIHYVFPNGSTMKDVAIYQQRRGKEHKMSWWPKSEMSVFEQFGVAAKVPFSFASKGSKKYDWSTDYRYAEYNQKQSGWGAGSRALEIVVAPSKSPTTVSDTDLGTCESPKFENLTPEQGQALAYVIVNEESDGFCVEKITAINKFPLRGNIVVKYKAVVYYQNGRNAHCLEVGGDYFERMMRERDTSCVANLSGRPLAAGSRAYFEGETEI